MTLLTMPNKIIYHAIKSPANVMFSSLSPRCLSVSSLSVDQKPSETHALWLLLLLSSIWGVLPYFCFSSLSLCSVASETGKVCFLTLDFASSHVKHY